MLLEILIGKVIMYADSLTDSMEKAISETNRRRKIQSDYNAEHGIIPKTIQKDIVNTLEITKKAEEIANLALTLCHMADSLMTGYLRMKADDFTENGGIRERMTAARLGRRQTQNQEIAALKAENARLKAEIARIRR